MKKILAMLIVVLVTTSYPVLADGVKITPYEESITYAELSDKVSGSGDVGAFSDYKTLVDSHIKRLLSMNSAERQSLVTELLTDAGTVYIGAEEIDFTEGGNHDFLAYAVTNVAETRRYMEHYGITAIADVPITLEFGNKDALETTLPNFYSSIAYNGGISKIIIKLVWVGVEFDILQFANLARNTAITVVLKEINENQFSDEYRKLIPSDEAYSLAVYDRERAVKDLIDTHILLYKAKFSDEVYTLSTNADGTLSKKNVDLRFDDVPLVDVLDNRIFWIEDQEEHVDIFPDVPMSHWAYEYIQSLAQKGIVSGNENGEFQPEANVTREQFVKMLVEGLNIELTDEKCNFTDADEEKWYYKYIATANRLGVINGITQNSFGVGQNIKREDVAVIIQRTINILGKELIIYSDFGQIFSPQDITSISPYANEALRLMHGVGIMSVDENNCIRPQDFATRSEIAKTLCKILEYIEE
ncbi:MAG: S-layer homology domain-containing protein [Eubacteriales bacterium]|nr:S-layer homology domain-containing protein [Eubacteriales bacterium]